MIKDLSSNRAPRVFLILAWFLGFKEVISKDTKGWLFSLLLLLFLATFRSHQVLTSPSTMARISGMCQPTQLFSVSAPVWSALQEHPNQPAARMDFLTPNGPRSLPCQVQSRSPPRPSTLWGMRVEEREALAQSSIRFEHGPPQDCRERKY